jgi:Ca2+-transporting ATPase
MHQPPRPAGEGVITRQMWRGIFLVGAVVAVGTLFVLDASLPGGFVPGTGDLPYGQTRAFVTLVFFSLFTVFAARSEERSAFRDLFSNRWLWAAVGLALVLQVMVVYVPVLQRAFGTVPLSAFDWAFCALVGSSVLFLTEGIKLLAGPRR